MSTDLMTASKMSTDHRIELIDCAEHLKLWALKMSTDHRIDLMTVLQKWSPIIILI